MLCVRMIDYLMTSVYVVGASIVLVILGDALKKVLNINNDAFFPFSVHVLALLIFVFFVYLEMDSQKTEACSKYSSCLEIGGLIIFVIYLASFLVLIQKPGYKERLFWRSKNK